MSPILDPDGRPIGSRPVLDPAQTTALLVAEMARLSGPAIVMLHPNDAMGLVGLLQLALRHPGVSNRLRDTADLFIESIRDYFAECPTVLDILARGDEPAEDV
jgi:hypothetical protein